MFGGNIIITRNRKQRLIMENKLLPRKRKRKAINNKNLQIVSKQLFNLKCKLKPLTNKNPGKMS